MTERVFSIDTLPGIQRDGTVLDRSYYNDGQWVRFQRGRPRKIGGYRVTSNKLSGPSRGIWVNALNSINYVFNGYNDGLQRFQVDDSGVGSGFVQIALSNFTASDLNLWQFDGFFDVAGSGSSTLVAHPGQNLATIDSTANTPVLIGDAVGSSMSQIGVFTDSVTTVSGSADITVAAVNLNIGAGQSITGAGIPADTIVTSVSGTTITLSANATASATVTATFNNNISVSGGVVVLHPYVFVYGNNGLIQNCSAGNANDWVSADANSTNVATGKIVKGLPVRGGSNSPSGLFWSLDSLVRVSYAPQSLGIANSADFAAPTFWRYDIISSQSSILSSQSVIEYDGIYYWCGVDRFLLYNGTVKEIPNSFNQNWFFDNLNYNQRQKVWATKVPRYGEIWWFYPRGDSLECNDAIIFNIREQCWYDAGLSVGAARTAGYFSQVFAYPIEAGAETTVSESITSGSYDVVSGSDHLLSDTYDTEIRVDLVASSANLPADTLVQSITTSGVKTLTNLVGGSGYTDNTYTDIPVTTGTGFNATLDITVSGNTVTAVTINTVGAGYLVGDTLEVDDADLGGGSGFSIDVSALWVQIIKLSAAATGTATETVAFTTQAGLIKIYQHEIGTDEVDGQDVRAIRSFFETSDLGLVAGGPSENSMQGLNRWLRLERVEPDFIMSGNMNLYVTGRPYAQSADDTSTPYAFSPTTNKIDMKEQRRELRLKFESDEAGGNYQLGRTLLSATIGDVRGY